MVDPHCHHCDAPATVIAWHKTMPTYYFCNEHVPKSPNPEYTWRPITLPHVNFKALLEEA